MNDASAEPLAEVAELTWGLLEQPSTATLATVLAKHGLWKGFVTGSRPLSPGRRMVGQAYTLRYLPAREDLDHNLVFDNSKDPQRLAIESVGPRDVLVIDARGDQRAGTMGNILATRMVARGAAGIVTDGCYRDSPAIAEMDIPAYAGSPHAATNKTIHHPVDCQLPVAGGGGAVVAAIGVVEELARGPDRRAQPRPGTAPPAGPRAPPSRARKARGPSAARSPGAPELPLPPSPPPASTCARRLRQCGR